MNYVVNTGDGLSFFGTRKEAEQEARSAIDYWRKIAVDDGEWPSEVEDVWWAEIQQSAEDVWPHGDETCDYQLRPEQPKEQ